MRYVGGLDLRDPDERRPVRGHQRLEDVVRPRVHSDRWTIEVSARALGEQRRGFEGKHDSSVQDAWPPANESSERRCGDVPAESTAHRGGLHVATGVHALVEDSHDMHPGGLDPVE